MSKEETDEAIADERRRVEGNSNYITTTPVLRALESLARRVEALEARNRRRSNRHTASPYTPKKVPIGRR